MFLAQAYDAWRRKRSCDGKRRMRYGEAQRYARRQSVEGKSFRAYRCEYCGHYHIGRTRGFEDRDPNEW